MPVPSAKRGAIPADRHALAAAKPYSAVPVAAPPTYLVIPQQLSFWGNDNYGDCVTAEEAFAKACNNPETFITGRRRHRLGDEARRAEWGRTSRRS